MTIAEVLQKATEGGYHIHGSDGVDTFYEGATNDYSAGVLTHGCLGADPLGKEGVQARGMSVVGSAADTEADTRAKTALYVVGPTLLIPLHALVR